MTGNRECLKTAVDGSNLTANMYCAQVSVMMGYADNWMEVGLCKHKYLILPNISNMICSLRLIQERGHFTKLLHQILKE